MITGTVESNVVGGRCRGALWLKRHTVVKVKGRGYRCKYCDKPMLTLKREVERKKR